MSIITQVSRKLKPWHLLIVIAALTITLLFLIVKQIESTSSTRHALPIPLLDQPKIEQAAEQAEKVSPPLATSSAVTTTPTNSLSTITTHTIAIKAGDTAAKLFANLNLSYHELQNILKLPAAKQPLTHLHAGQIISFQTQNNKLLHLNYAYNQQEALVIQQQNSKYTAKIEKKPLQTRILYKSFTVHGSLMTSANHAGLPSAMSAQLAQILGHTLNIKRDVHPKDQVAVLYNEYYLNGKKYKPANIAMATFSNPHHTYQVIRFTDPSGKTAYYTPKGMGLESAFLSAPLHYKRISSVFSFHRLDPYLHRVHPHLGIDFAAKSGTPIQSIGDGVVVSRGWEGGYGNAVVIAYQNKYKALYGHMSRIVANLKPHQRVHKGQVIGYVGSTGWSTGAHLHFGWYVNGVACDPLKHKPAGSNPIPAPYRRAFLALSRSLMAKLTLHKHVKFAENNAIHHRVD